MFYFFFNNTPPTEIYTLSLHDALPIFDDENRLLGNGHAGRRTGGDTQCPMPTPCERWRSLPDRKSTRLNSSHSQISYAVFCLKKKKINNNSFQDMVLVLPFCTRWCV